MRKYPHILLIALTMLLLLLASSASAADKAVLCRVELHSLSRTSGAPGDVFEMHGKWEESQGGKTASINMGSSNKLEVLSWSNSVIRVRIPEGLRPGSYKVGVYCNNPPHWQGSGFKDFEVTGSGSEAGSYEGRPLIEGPDSDNERRAESIPQAGAPQRVAPTEEGDAITADTEKNLNTGIWVLVLIVIAIIVIVRKRSVIVIAPYPEQTSKETPAASSPSGNKRLTEHWTGVYKGVQYTVEHLGDDMINLSPIMTVHIGIPELLPKRLEVNARGKRPVIPDERAKDINALLDLGVNYIDISYNTNWIAAEAPVNRVIIDRPLAEKIVEHLIRLRDLSK